MVGWCPVFDAGLSASDEEQLDLFNLLEMPWDEPDHVLTFKAPKWPKRLKQLAFNLDSQVIDNITVTGNRIEIDKGLFLAPNTRVVNSDLLLADRVDASAVEILIDGHLKKLKECYGLKRLNPIYCEVMNYLFANLSAAHNSQSELIYSRDTSVSGGRPLVKTVDYFEVEGMIKNIRGKKNEYQGNSSWMIPTDKLNSQLEVIDVRIELKRNATVIKLRGLDIEKTKKVYDWVKVSKTECEATGADGYYKDGVFNRFKETCGNETVGGKSKRFKIVSELRNKKGKSIEVTTKYEYKKVSQKSYVKGKLKKINTGNKSKKLQVKRLSAPVNSFNDMWNSHDITLDGLNQIPYCTRSFKGSLELGGRFFTIGTVQTRPKIIRAEFLIDGERVIEPDFKAIHWVIMYAMAGIRLNPKDNDPYIIDGFDREVAKLCMLTFANSSNISSFKANITKSSNPRNKKIMKEYKQAMITFMDDVKAGRLAREPNKPLLAKGFIEGLPDYIDADELVDSIQAKHHQIADLMNRPDVGLKLQYIDGQIMARILSALSSEDIPTIPVHDSVICKESDLDRVVEVMKEAFKYVTKFDGIVEC